MAESALWGATGESWNTTRLPDFSRAGYRSGISVIPTPAAVFDIKTDYGAVGDGTTNDTQAFLDAVAVGGTIFIPTGTYRIEQRITISQSDVILRGNGEANTTLLFPFNLIEAEGGIPGDYSHHEGFLDLHGTETTSIEECGIENLSIQFPNVAYGGHLTEDGYNALYIYWAKNCWFRNITIENTDLAVNLWFDVRFTTVQNVSITGRMGHYGFLLKQSHHNLIEGFSITPQMVHDCSVTTNTYYNVFRNGSGTNINFDHHKEATPAANNNLFSNINIGTGSRPYESSGTGGAPQSGPRETFWNIRDGSGTGLSSVPDFGDGVPAGVVVVGATFDQVDVTNGEYIEQITPVNLLPVDLLESQVSYRLANTPPWQYQQRFTVASGKMPGAETNLPLLFHVNSSHLATNAQADGDDISFWDADGWIQIPHEIESYANGELLAHLKPDSANVGTDILMQYGAATAPNQENVSEVWNSNGEYGVWHAIEDPSGTPPQILDSTANARHGTSGGTMLTEDLINAYIGKGLDFDGIDDRIAVGTLGNFGSELDTQIAVIQLWIRTTSTALFSILGGGNNTYFSLYANTSSAFTNVTGNIALFARRSGPTNELLGAVDIDTGITDGSWHHIVCWFNMSNNTIGISVDGQAQSVTISRAETIINTSDFTSNITIGAEGNLGTPGSFGAQQLRDVRLSLVATSPSVNRVTSIYNNSSDPDTFWTAGPIVELVPRLFPLSYLLLMTRAQALLAESFNAEPGSYTLTGIDIAAAITVDGQSGSLIITGSDIAAAITSDSELGSYSITGSDAQLNANYAIDCEAGNYSITGSDIAYAISENIETAAYTLAGSDIGSAITQDSQSDSYTITGADANLVETLVAESLNCEAGSYTVTGSDVNAAVTQDTESGTYALTGADISVSVALDANSGTYTVTGVDADFTITVNSNSGSYTLTGSATEFLTHYALDANAGSYTLSGIAAIFGEPGGAGPAIGIHPLYLLLFTRPPAAPGAEQLNSEAGTYTLSGSDIAVAISINCESGSYAVSGVDLSISIAEDSEAGNYNHTGASITAAITTDESAGTYIFTGADTSLVTSGEEGIIAEVGSYSIVGANAELNAHYSLNCEAGSYSISGSNVIGAITQNLEPGTYNVSGDLAEVLAHYAENIQTGTFILSGSDISLAITQDANAGILTLTGQDIVNVVELQLNAGAYVISGQSANLVNTGAESFVAEVGTYNLVGADTNLATHYSFNCEAGSYAVTGADASVGITQDAQAGTYTLTGTDAYLNAHYTETANAGNYVLTGTDADLVQAGAGQFDAESGSYGLVGVDANLAVHHVFSCESGTYSINGSNLSPHIGKIAESGVYILTGVDVNVLGFYVENAESGNYAIIGSDVLLARNTSINAEAGTYALTGSDIEFIIAYILEADAGVYSLNGVDATLGYTVTVIPPVIRMGSIMVRTSDLTSIEMRTQAISGVTVES